MDVEQAIGVWLGDMDSFGGYDAGYREQEEKKWEEDRVKVAGERNCASVVVHRSKSRE